MKGMKHFWWVFLIILTIVFTGCQQMDEVKNTGWEKLSSGSIIKPESELPSIGGYLFNTESELHPWLESYDIKLPIENIDFSEGTVAVIIQGWIPYDLKSVSVINKKAKVTLLQYHNMPAPAPNVPVGSEIRRFIILQLPKSQSIEIVVEEK